MRRAARHALTVMLLVAPTSTILAAGLDSRMAIERAVRHIELAHYALARSYLERPLIDGRITPTERSRAYYLHGYTLERQGMYVSAAQDYAKALSFNPTNPGTLSALANLYSRGLGVSRDQDHAGRLWQQAAELGHAPAMASYGAFLLGEPGAERTPFELDAAREWLHDAADAEQAVAYLHLARSYRTGYTDPPQPEQAVAFYEKALVMNEASAFVALGHMALEGELGAPDERLAADYFRRGVEHGVGAAHTRLGYFYLTGNAAAGIEQDLERARALLETAAAGDDARAHYYLGYLSELTAPPDQDAKNSSPHYLRAAELGHAPAFVRLSRLARQAGDVPGAIRLLRRAVEAGHNRAKNALAWLLATHPEDALRDGVLAVRLAEDLVTTRRTSATLDTLAAAYAETERYRDAIDMQQQALTELATEPGGERYTAQFELRLQTYRAGQPWREP